MFLFKSAVVARFTSWLAIETILTARMTSSEDKQRRTENMFNSVTYALLSSLGMIVPIGLSKLLLGTATLFTAGRVVVNAELTKAVNNIVDEPNIRKY